MPRARAGALSPTALAPPSLAPQLDRVRRAARADGSAGRLLDGHLNGVERLEHLAPEPLRAAELSAVAAGRRRLAVWGADPRPGEGMPARIAATADGLTLQGVKVFCSGAGLAGRALVTARGPHDEASLVYVDLSAGTTVDRAWFRGPGMEASESHRVIFRGAPVLAVLGEPGELVREPWLSRDAVRTAACWAGMADAAGAIALAALRDAPSADLAGLAAGRVIAALGRIDRWLDAAEAELVAAEGARAFSVALRVEVAEACSRVLEIAVQAVGAGGLARGAALEPVRRDLEFMLLQHRLEPLLASVGRAALEGGR